MPFILVLKSCLAKLVCRDEAIENYKMKGRLPQASAIVASMKCNTCLMCSILDGRRKTFKRFLVLKYPFILRGKKRSAFKFYLGMFPKQ